MKKLSYLIIFLSALLLSGCLSSINLPQKNLYTLSPKKVKVKTYPTTNKTLLVLSTQASDQIDNKKMAYVSKPYRLAFFTQNAWAAEPADMLSNLIANRLRQTHYFKAVVTSPFVGTTSFKLATHLSKLQQNFLLKPSREQLQLSAQLISGNTGKAIAEKTFYYSIRTPSNNPYGGVIAANQAVTKLLHDLAGFVVKNA